MRDRAILKFYLYTGARIETGCKLNVSDFPRTVTKRHCAFISKAGASRQREFISARRSPSPSTSRPPASRAVPSSALAFPLRRRPGPPAHDRAQHVPRTDELSGAASERNAAERAAVRGKDPGVHLFAAFDRATTATLLLDSSVPIESVQDLLDHKHITTTQIYDKRRRSVRDSASHKVPI